MPDQTMLLQRLTAFLLCFCLCESVLILGGGSCVDHSDCGQWLPNDNQYAGFCIAYSNGTLYCVCRYGYAGANCSQIYAPRYTNALNQTIPIGNGTQELYYNPNSDPLFSEARNTWPDDFNCWFPNGHINWTTDYTNLIIYQVTQDTTVYCECFAGFSGSYCNIGGSCFIASDCNSPNGNCVTGRCVCNFGYTGLNCENSNPRGSIATLAPYAGFQAVNQPSINVFLYTPTQVGVCGYVPGQNANFASLNNMGYNCEFPSVFGCVCVSGKTNLTYGLWANNCTGTSPVITVNKTVIDCVDACYGYCDSCQAYLGSGEGDFIPVGNLFYVNSACICYALTQLDEPYGVSLSCNSTGGINGSIAIFCGALDTFIDPYQSTYGLPVPPTVCLVSNRYCYCSYSSTCSQVVYSQPEYPFLLPFNYTCQTNTMTGKLCGLYGSCVTFGSQNSTACLCSSGYYWSICNTPNISSDLTTIGFNSTCNSGCPGYLCILTGNNLTYACSCSPGSYGFFCNLTANSTQCPTNPATQSQCGYPTFGACVNHQCACYSGYLGPSCNYIAFIINASVAYGHYSTSLIWNQQFLSTVGYPYAGYVSNPSTGSGICVNGYYGIGCNGLLAYGANCSTCTTGQGLCFPSGTQSTYGCYCFSSYYGPSCSLIANVTQCPLNLETDTVCGYPRRGACVNAACSCFVGYTGTACETNVQVTQANPASGHSCFGGNNCPVILPNGPYQISGFYPNLPGWNPTTNSSGGYPSNGYYDPSIGFVCTNGFIGSSCNQAYSYLSTCGTLLW